MIIDKNGNILTDLELIKMSIRNTVINSGATDTLIKHLDDLIKDLEGTEEYKRYDKNYNFYLEEIKNCLPLDKKELTVKLDDCYTKILILYQEYFYKHGYYDNFEKRNVFERIILKLKGKHQEGGL